MARRAFSLSGGPEQRAMEYNVSRHFSRGRLFGGRLWQRETLPETTVKCSLAFLSISLYPSPALYPGRCFPGLTALYEVVKLAVERATVGPRA